MCRAVDTAMAVVKLEHLVLARVSEALDRLREVALALQEPPGAVCSVPPPAAIPLPLAAHSLQVQDLAATAVPVVEGSLVPSQPEAVYLVKTLQHQLSQAADSSAQAALQALAPAPGLVLAAVPQVEVSSAVTALTNPTATPVSNPALQQLVPLGNQPLEASGSRMPRVVEAFSVALPPLRPHLVAARGSRVELPTPSLVLGRIYKTRTRVTQALPLEGSVTISRSRSLEVSSATLEQPIPGAACLAPTPTTSSRHPGASSATQVIPNRLGEDSLVISPPHLGPVEAYLKI